jgi:hypothetical protein
MGPVKGNKAPILIVSAAIADEERQIPKMNSDPMKNPARLFLIFNPLSPFLRPVLISLSIPFLALWP